MVSLYFKKYLLNYTYKEINGNALDIFIISVKVIANELKNALDFNTKPQHLTYNWLDKMK